ncbi:MAG TPA: hypothetical protein VGC96_02850 [Candidatus Elarobacter sp.]|jgi:hypothetical protein
MLHLLVALAAVLAFSSGLAASHPTAHLPGQTVTSNDGGDWLQGSGPPGSGHG